MTAETGCIEIGYGEIESLRQQLAAAQEEVEDNKTDFDKKLAIQFRDIAYYKKQLAAALAACKLKDRKTQHFLDDGEYEALAEALAIQPDDAALEAVIAKAGEKMRERCIAEFLIRTHWYAEEGIRALPGVTLENLK